MHFERNWIAFRTYMGSELRRTLLLWKQTLLPSMMSTSLYFAIFGKLLGTRMGSVAEISYLEFIVPGLIMMNILMSSFHASVFVVFMAKFVRSIEEILVSPMHTSTILCCFAGAGLMRGLLVGTAVTGVALCFTPLEVQHPVWIIGIAALASSIFSLFGVINGLYAKNFDQTAVATTFIITPLSYLGGIFYALSMLPPLWQKLAYANPIVYLIGSFRYGFYGKEEIPVNLSLGLMLLLWVILIAICYRLIERRTGISD